MIDIPWIEPEEVGEGTHTATTDDIPMESSSGLVCTVRSMNIC